MPTCRHSSRDRFSIPDEPVSIGAMVGPEAFIEVRYLAHVKQMQALELIPGWADRVPPTLSAAKRAGSCAATGLEDAETVVVALGSVLGTVKDTIDEMRAAARGSASLGISCFRPWPLDVGAHGARGAKRVVVLEKSLAVGVGGIVVDQRQDALTAARSGATT